MKKLHILMTAVMTFAWTTCYCQMLYNNIDNDQFPSILSRDVPSQITEPDSRMTIVCPDGNDDLTPDPTPPVQEQCGIGTLPYSIDMGLNGRPIVSVPITDFACDAEVGFNLAFCQDGNRTEYALGPGWRISGVPMIRRVPKDWYTDGNVSAIKVDTCDAFSIDGERLVYVATRDGFRCYQTQRGNTLVRIDKKGDFWALYPDGRVFFFDSSEENYNNNGIVYGPTKCTWPDGQTVRYSYARRALVGNVALSSVTDGKGRSIDFNYRRFKDEYNRSRMDYVAGKRIKHYMKMSSVIVSRDGQRMCSYELGGSDENVNTPVSEICRYGDDSISCSKISLTYTSNGVTPSTTFDGKETRWLTQYFNSKNLNTFVITGGEFDYGSGIGGFVMYPGKDAYSFNIWSGYHSLYGASEELIATTLMHYGADNILSERVQLGDGFVGAMAIDADASSGDELLMLNNTVTNGMDVLNMRAYKFSSTGQGKTLLWQSSVSERALEFEESWSVSPKTFLSGDFDGDGRSELLVIDYSGYRPLLQGRRQGLIRVIGMDGGHLKAAFPIDSCHAVMPMGEPDEDERLENYKKSDRVFALDYNGDGKVELGVVNAGGLHLYSFSYDSDRHLVMEHKEADVALNRDSVNAHTLFAADFNGDGNSDLLLLKNVVSVPDASDRNNRVYRNYAVFRSFMGKGDGSFFIENRVVKLNTGEKLVSVNPVVADIDLDGAADIVLHTSKSKATAIFFTGTSPMEVSLNGDGRMIPLKDFTGNVNVSPLATIDKEGCLRTYSINSACDARRTIKAIDDHCGNKHQFTYGRMFRASDMKFEPRRYSFPFSAIADGSLVCIGHRHAIKGGEIVSDISYSYKNPVVHRQGLAFIGFDQVTATNNLIPGRCITTEYDPVKMGVPVAVSTTESVDSMTYTIEEDRTLRRIELRHVGTSSRNRVTGASNMSRFIHDKYGNVIHATIAYGDGSFVTTEHTWDNKAGTGNGPYIIGLETGSKQTVKREGETWVTGRKIEYTPACKPRLVKEYVGDLAHVTSTLKYTYDGSNRLTSVAASSYNGPSRTKLIFYAASGRRVGATVSELGINTNKVLGKFGPTKTYELPVAVSGGSISIGDGIGFRSSMGDVVSNGITDSNGEVHNNVTEDVSMPFEYHYDVFGRVDSVTLPSGDGVKTVIKIADGREAPSNCSYYTERRETGKPIVRTYYDGLDRKVRSMVQRPDGTWLKTDYSYNSLGLLDRESDPYKGSSPKAWTCYTYDVHGRLISKSYPDGHSDNYSYNGLTTISCVNGQRSEVTVDELGYVTNVEQDGSSIDYVVRPDGQPHEITIDGERPTTFTYDNYGRPVSIADPSAGVQTKEYDAAGNVCAVTDAAGRRTENVFNDHGQLTCRRYGNGKTATWTYENHGIAVGMNDNAGSSWELMLDQFLRPKSETIDGFRKSYTYSGNNLVKIAYYDNCSYICDERREYANGTLSKIMAGTKTIWKLENDDDRGLPTQAGIGPLIQRYGYDAMGRVTNRVVERQGGRDPVLHTEYSYSPSTGNLSSFKSLAGSQRQENYSYDTMNRLTGNGTQEYAYDSHGNITVKGSVTGFSYEPERPYAVSRVSFSSLIPTRSQHLAFNVMHLPDTIAEGDWRAVFSYRGDNSRAVMTMVNEANGDSTVKTYRGEYEVTTLTAGNGGTTSSKSVLWLGGGPYVSPAAYVREHGSKQWELRFALRDNLGSITHVTDSAGNVLQHVSYDPWGVLCDPATMTPYGADEQPELLLGRGYTGHEHLPWFGLINMNARLYDPVIGRFLSPDPLVHSPIDVQCYNRYSYCLNNPLRYVDPTGMDFWLALPKVVVYGNRPPEITKPIYIPMELPKPVKLQERVLFDFHNNASGPSIAHDNLALGSSGGGGALSTSLDVVDDACFVTGSFVRINEELCYSPYFETWRGKNGKFYEGLKGRGPNQYTGSRMAAAAESDLWQRTGKSVSAVGWASKAVQTKDIFFDNNGYGPNELRYLQEKLLISSFVDVLGERGDLICFGLCFGYNLGAIIQDLGIHIQYNPYTHDFTPMREYLREMDRLGIRVYY